VVRQIEERKSPSVGGSARPREGVSALREVFRWQRRQAKKLGVKKPKTGAVCFTERFGSRARSLPEGGLDLSVHHHCVLPDGVFTVGEEGVASLVKLARPSEAELLVRIVKKTLALVGESEDEPLDAHSQAQVEAVQAPLGIAPAHPRRKPMSAFLEGFSLEAGTHVHEHDRKGLEHLCRYGLRPPLAKDRLSIAEDGRVVIELKRPMYDGTTQVAYQPVAFLRRLAAIVPPPRFHTTRYFEI